MMKNESNRPECDACGRYLRQANGETVLIGMQISVIVDEKLDDETKGWYTDQMYPYEVNREYSICFPCWLKSLGIKPEKGI